MMKRTPFSLAQIAKRALASSAILAFAAASFAQAVPSSITVHYHRFDGDYTDAGLWTWDGRDQKNPTNQEVMPSGKTDFGLTFTVQPANYGNDDSAQERIGFIPRLRRDWNFKDGGDRFWTPNMGPEIWLIGNDPRVYTSKPDISPRINNAHIDKADTIILMLSHRVPTREVVKDTFTIRARSGNEIALKSVSPLTAENGQTNQVEVITERPLDIASDWYYVAGMGMKEVTAKPRRILDDASIFSTDQPLGAVYTPEATTFRTFSPLAEAISVVLYDHAVGKDGRRVVPMTRQSNGSWETKVEGDLEGKFYRLLVKTMLHGEQEIIDPWATNTTGNDGNARITDLRKADPPGFRPVNRPAYGDSPTDAIIWEVHIRDFTIDPNSGVDAKHRGKYTGFVQTGTHHPADARIKTGIEYLKHLGVTHVHLLPPQDFDNNESNPEYSWGYMTSFFNSPDGWFSSDIRTQARVTEFKQMVKGLHEAGIGVIVDVVYNHTGTQNTFELLAPGYFHRMREDGSFWNGSGTGNEFRSEAPMGRRFIVDSLKFWMDEYGVDGFRFDLMGLMDLETLKQAKAELKKMYPQVLYYGEPWAATGPDGTGIARITYKDVVRGTDIAAFNDHFRNALKGAPDGPDAGYVQNGSRRDEVKRGIAGSIDDWAANPTESVNYATSHDNKVLWDKWVVSAPNNTREEWIDMTRLTGSVLAFSQGILFYHSAEEMLRTKGGNHNSYNAGDAVNAIQWDWARENWGIVDYHAGLIALRRAHPMFRLDTAAQVRQRLKFHDNLIPHPQAIVYTLDGRGLEGETWQDAIVLINPTPQAKTFTLPLQGDFSVFVHDDKAGTTSITEATGTLEVPARSLSLLAR